MKLHEPVPREWLIGGAVVLAVVALVILTGGGVWVGRNVQESPTPTDAVAAPGAAQPKPSNSMPELTSSTGTYKCSGNKTFTLSLRSDGTARVTGSDSSGGKVLKKTSIGIWTSDDSSVVVREIAGYTILVENSVTTRDSCTIKK
jgi:hypothetical protein